MRRAELIPNHCPGLLFFIHAKDVIQMQEVVVKWIWFSAHLFQFHLFREQFWVVNFAGCTLLFHTHYFNLSLVTFWSCYELRIEKAHYHIWMHYGEWLSEFITRLVVTPWLVWTRRSMTIYFCPVCYHSWSVGTSPYLCHSQFRGHGTRFAF